MDRRATSKTFKRSFISKHNYALLLVVLLSLMGCGPRLTRDSEATSHQLDLLYDAYLQGDIQKARASLLSATLLLEQAQLPRAEAKAHGLWLAFARLYRLELAAGHQDFADAYLLQSQYWHLRKLVVSGETEEEAMKHVRAKNGDALCKLVDEFDRKNSGGRGPAYLRGASEAKN